MRLALIAVVALVGCTVSEPIPEGAGLTEACPRPNEISYVKTVDDSGIETFWHADDVSCITVYTDPIGRASPSPAEKHAAVQRSIATWNAAAEGCVLALCLRDGGSNPPAGAVGHNTPGANANVVTFIDDRGRWESTFPEAASAFGITLITSVVGSGRMVDSDIFVNEGRFAHSVASETEAGKADLESVITHELGHLLGFDHTQTALAVMFDSLGTGVAKRSLHPIDVTGLCELYACY